MANAGLVFVRPMTASSALRSAAACHWKIELKFHIYELDREKKATRSQELYEIFNQKLIFLNKSRRLVTDREEFRRKRVAGAQWILNPHFI